MCVAMPGEVVDVKDGTASVSFGTIKKNIVTTKLKIAIFFKFIIFSFFVNFVCKTRINSKILLH